MNPEKPIENKHTLEQRLRAYGMSHKSSMAIAFQNAADKWQYIFILQGEMWGMMYAEKPDVVIDALNRLPSVLHCLSITYQVMLKMDVPPIKDLPQEKQKEIFDMAADWCRYNITPSSRRRFAKAVWVLENFK